MAKITLFFFLMLSSVWTTCSGAKCGYPGSPAFGHPVPIYSLYEEGKTVTYTCNNGYFMVGQPTRVCLPNGTWSGVMPICDTTLTALGHASASDALPPYLPNLAIDGNKATCFHSNSRKPRWWRVDMKGNHHVVSVAITVPTTNTQHYFQIFVISVNGTRAAYNRCASFSGTFASQKAILMCGDGKGIKGSFIHIEDYRPQYDYFGLCEVEIFTRKESYDCGDPERPAHGFTVSAPVGESEYRCVAGYRLLGPIRRRCQSSSGQWTGPQPVCQEIVCKDLSDLPNGRVRVTGPSGSRAVQGSKAFYTCDPGYRLSGNRTRTCLENSWWSGEDPFCQPINCGMPDVGNAAGHFLLLNGSTAFPSLAELRCRNDEEMTAGHSRIIQCKEDGTWSRLEARCIIQEIAAISQTKDGGGGLPTGAIVGTVVVLLLLSFVLLVLFLMRRKRHLYQKDGSCSPTQALDTSSRSSNGAGYYADQDGSSYQNEPFYAELQKRVESRSTELCASSSNPSTRTGTPSSRTPLKGRPNGSRWALPSFRSRSKTDSNATSRKSSMSSRGENIYEEITFGALRSLLCNSSSRRSEQSQTAQSLNAAENGQAGGQPATSNSDDVINSQSPNPMTQPGVVDPSVLELYAKVDFSKKRKNRLSKDSDDLEDITRDTGPHVDGDGGYDVLSSPENPLPCVAIGSGDQDVPFKLRELPPIPDEDECEDVKRTARNGATDVKVEREDTRGPPYLLLDNAIYAGHPAALVDNEQNPAEIMVENELYSSR